ncbi:hypothetical protein GC425_09825 [Corynebacterium sp. zg254]|uniref:DUF3311 domain-containing protein n=1 Tax=Corynebacterium zhongnanshanii TaxID=2768834 RepID=A0ABQ6VBH0_9CORY|nr:MULTISPECIES: hypothetical protein [Corynebacterium]KAB3519016.1 hypothetical protein F8377_09865 [Corynebacterium zhongnanshanii]MCR5915133.1 hypothetical protein [Corynebacterium sp. zg254]
MSDDVSVLGEEFPSGGGVERAASGVSEGPSGRDVARGVVTAMAGAMLLLPGVAVMPRLGVWMVEHGPFVVMLPFMLWMMLAGGLVSSGVMSVWHAAKGQ